MLSRFLVGRVLYISVSPCLWLDDVSMTSPALLSIVLIASNFALLIAKSLLVVQQTDIAKFSLTI
jgi:hypothetical protein